MDGNDGTFYFFSWDDEAEKELTIRDFDGQISITLIEARRCIKSAGYIGVEIRDFDPGSLIRGDYPEAIFLVLFGDGLPDGFDTVVALNSMPSVDDREEFLDVLQQARLFVEENQEPDIYD